MSQEQTKEGEPRETAQHHPTSQTLGFLPQAPSLAIFKITNVRTQPGGFITETKLDGVMDEWMARRA